MPPRKVQSFDLNGIPNNDCIGKCNSVKRKDVTDGDLCNMVKSVRDKLPVRCVGEHALRKIYLLCQYFGAFTNAMRHHFKGRMNYIEICSGPGRCIFRESKEEVDGTALSVMQHSNFDLINKAIFIDYNEKVIEILQNRINNLNKSNVATACVGDYNNITQISSILSGLNKDCLNLVFIDPTDCSLPFTTIREISRTLNKVDFIINFAVFSDPARHLRHALLSKDRYSTSRQKYSNFIGNDDFFNEPENIRLAEKDGTEEDLRERFKEEYCNSFRKMGYLYYDPVRISKYYLFFASREEIALNLWKNIQRRDELGQTSLLPQLFQ